MFDDGKSTLKKLLEVNSGRVALTTDLWTASNQKKGYMAVTTNFIDNDWILHKRTLRYAHLHLRIKMLCNKFYFDVLLICFK